MSKKKLKILMIGTTDKKGGAAMASWKLAEGLRREGYWVKHIVGYKYSNSSCVDQLPTRLGKSGSLYFRHLRSYLLSNDQDYGEDKYLFSHSWYKKADIIHLQNTHGNYISINSIKRISQEKNFIWTLHDMWPITSHCAYTNNPESKNHNPLDCSSKSYPPIFWNNKDRLWTKKQKFLKESEITLISSSKWLASKFKYISLNSKSSIHQIYNGVDVDIFRNRDMQKSRKKLDIKSSEKVGLYIAQGGKKDPRKGYQYIESLAWKNPQNTFYVVGGNKSYQQKNIKFISKISNPYELSDYYNASDVFIFPSLADNNPQVVLEAYSCKTPVLGFNACGTTELIDHKKTGYLAKYKDSKDLLVGFKYLISSSLSSRNFSKDFSIDKMIASHKNLYRKIISQK